MEKSLLNVLNIVLAHAGRPEITEFRAETHLQKDLGLGSFHLAELSVRLEQEFGKDVFRSGMVYTLGGLIKRLHD